jgi:hypothetical protein
VFEVSFVVFSIYRGLIGGEALSDKDIISPFWAVGGQYHLRGRWTAAHDPNGPRGRDVSRRRIGEWFDALRARFVGRDGYPKSPRPQLRHESQYGPRPIRIWRVLKIFVAALGFPLLVIVIDLTDHLRGYLTKDSRARRR